MLIEKISIVNKKINIIDQKFDFSKNGIYIFKGENGSGKTTTIKKILFEKYNVSFGDASFKDHFDKNKRYKLFSYVPQYIYPSNIAIKNYLFPFQSNKNKEIINLFKIFDLNFDPNCKIQVLSTGERMKLAIIRALAKKTPYIFLDEVTNNLDNKSVNTLIAILKKYSKNHVIIISSHDKRILDLKDVNGTYKFSNKKIEFTPGLKSYQEQLKLSEIKNMNIFSFLYNFLFKPIQLLTVAVTILFIFNLNLYITDSLFKNYHEDEQKNNNIVFVYDSDKKISQWNIDYTKNQKIKIDLNNSNRIKYTSITNLMENEKIETIYFHDIEYDINLAQKINEKTAINDINLISIPDFIANNYSDSFGFFTDYLLYEGKFPKDYKNEILISKNLLVKHFNYDINLVDKAIEDYIIINQEKYKIVGFHHLDIAVVSFDKKNNFGIYQYQNKEDYINFSNKLSKYMEAKEYFETEVISSFFIKTKENKEKEVLDYLMKNYSANNFLSNSYSKILARVYNQKILVDYFIKTNILVILFSVIIFFINKSAIKINLKIIDNFDNYYITNNKIKHIYSISSLLLLLVSSLISIFILTRNSKFAFFIQPLFFEFLIIIIIPLCFLYFRRKT